MPFEIVATFILHHRLFQDSNFRINSSQLRSGVLIEYYYSNIADKENPTEVEALDKYKL